MSSRASKHQASAPPGTEASVYAGLDAKPHKYRAVRTTVDGITFASKKEAARYTDLKTLENGGVIDSLILQKRFELWVKGDRICTYIADFVYFEGMKIVVEDRSE